MSLDLTFEALMRFSQELTAFDETLQASYRELRRCHEEIDAIWRDEMRRTYDRVIEDLDARLGAYFGGESERFEEFIRLKLRQLDSYLHGH
jgi:hypothetical protein